MRVHRAVNPIYIVSDVFETTCDIIVGIYFAKNQEIKLNSTSKKFSTYFQQQFSLYVLMKMQDFEESSKLAAVN